MGHKKKSFWYRLCRNENLLMYVACLGIGMILVAVLPIRVWIAFAGIVLIGIAFYCFCK